MSSHTSDTFHFRASTLQSASSSKGHESDSYAQSSVAPARIIWHPILGQPISEDEFQQFLMTLKLDDYRNMGDDEKCEHLARFDALKMAEVINYMRIELAEIKLEYFLFFKLLEENDAHVLLLLKEQRTSAQRKLALGPRVRSIDSRTSSRSISSASAISFRSSASVGRIYKINYRAKTELAEKLQFQVEDRLKALEQRGANVLKGLQARINELQMATHEIIETWDNFKLHFMTTAADLDYLERATIHQLERKLRKFVTNWGKSADALVAKGNTQRLKVDGSCRETSAKLIVRSELAAYLTAPDYEKLTILRDEQLSAYEEKLIVRNRIRKCIGATARQVKVRRNNLEARVRAIRKLENSCKLLHRHVSIKETELKLLKKDVDKQKLRYKLVKEKIEKFAAPSLQDYWDIKEKLQMLEKQEKIMERKYGILEMTLKNKQKQRRRKAAK